MILDILAVVGILVVGCKRNIDLEVVVHAEHILAYLESLLLRFQLPLVVVGHIRHPLVLVVGEHIRFQLQVVVVVVLLRTLLLPIQ